MELVAWLNRTFRINTLSAPLAAMAGGAEGVSMMHPIESYRSIGILDKVVDLENTDK